MRNATRDITWIHEDAEGNPSEDIGEQKFTVTFRRPDTQDDVLVLTGGEERLFDLIEQRQSTYPNPFKKKFMEAKDKASALLVIQQVIDAGKEVDLITTRGTGVNAKAAKFDEMQAALANAGNNQDAKIAALRAMGFDI